MRTLAKQLAAAFLAGPWRLDELVARSAAVLERRPRWFIPLARRLIAAYEENAPLRLAELAAKIEDDRAFQRACEREELSAATVIWDVRPEMRPVQAAAGWRLPAVLTPGALAAWLGVTSGELEWFADRQGREFKQPPGPLRHYRYRWLDRRRGPPRLIETPKARLKSLQRRMLRDMLDRIPPHEAAHGFRTGRSIKSYSAGVVVNQRANLARDEYERLKATLHNCARYGPAGQNREQRADFRACLAGRIGHVAMLNPARGEKLKAVFAQIRWPSLT